MNGLWKKKLERMVDTPGPSDIARFYSMKGAERRDAMVPLFDRPMHKWSYLPSNSRSAGLLEAPSGKGRLSRLKPDELIDDYALRAGRAVQPFYPNINKNIAQMRAVLDFRRTSVNNAYSLSSAFELKGVPFGPGMNVRRFWVDAIIVIDGCKHLVAMDPRTGPTQLTDDSLELMLAFLHHYPVASDYRLSDSVVGVFKSEIIDRGHDSKGHPTETRRLLPHFLEGSPCCSREEARQIVADISSEFAELKDAVERRRATSG